MTTPAETTTQGDGKGTTPAPAASVLGDAAAKAAPAGNAPPAAQDTTQKPANAEGAKPAELTLKLPDGVTMDADALAGFKAKAQELKLDGATAQSVLDFYLAEEARLEKANDKVLADQAKKWADELKADPEFGGAKFDGNMALAGKAVVRFAGKEFVDFLNATGLGSHPALVRAFARIGAAIAEDKVDGTLGGAAAAAARPLTIEERARQMYPNSPGLFPKKD